MIHMTDHPLVDGPCFACHRSDTEQNDISSPPLRQQRDGNKWAEHRQKGDTIRQYDRQQPQQTTGLLSEPDRHHNKEEYQGVTGKTMRKLL